MDSVALKSAHLPLLLAKTKPLLLGETTNVYWFNQFNRYFSCSNHQVCLNPHFDISLAGSIAFRLYPHDFSHKVLLQLPFALPFSHDQHPNKYIYIYTHIHIYIYMYTYICIYHLPFDLSNIFFPGPTVCPS